jgi:predicted MFS family arabinose efflux permease
MLWLTALVLGVAEVFFDNASQALVPSVVPPELLERANGRRYAAEVAANTFVGTPLGSVLFAAAVWIPFGVDAASFALAVALVLTLRGSFRARADAASDALGEPPARRSIAEETRDGLRWLWSHAVLRTLAIALGLSNLGFQVAQAIFVLFALNRLGVSERGFGVLLAFMGAGAIIGALLGERIGARLGQATAVHAALVIWTISMTLIGLFPVTWFVAVLATVESIAGTVWNVVTVSMRQQMIPAHLLGRVNSVYRWFGWGTMPIGSLIGGQVARVAGLRAPYFVGAGFVAVALVLSLRGVDNDRIAAAMPSGRGPSDGSDASAADAGTTVDDVGLAGDPAGR